MIKPISGTLKFIRVERNQGVSKEGKEYDVSTLTLSDGDESFPVNVDKNLVANMQTELRKGDFAEFVFEAAAGYRGTSYTVISFKKVNQFAKVN